MLQNTIPLQTSRTFHKAIVINSGYRLFTHATEIPQTIPIPNHHRRYIDRLEWGWGEIAAYLGAIRVMNGNSLSLQDNSRNKAQDGDTKRIYFGH